MYRRPFKHSHRCNIFVFGPILSDIDHSEPDNHLVDPVVDRPESDHGGQGAREGRA